jgi:hypothetical protein
MSDIYTEAYRARIVREFAERRHEVEHVTMFTHEGRQFVVIGNSRPRDVTPMEAQS